ncbi:MAG: hypothetical protein JJ896_00325 [Rhodothermales bacterium]|nr:hypothetical protein [Rhodothermales bacterium]MBO6778071.1 hypothetical protein [Rhodothermales bacterium]
MLILIWGHAAHAHDVPADTLDAQRAHRPYFFYQYQNDSAPFGDRLGPFRTGPDDYVTTGLWLRWQGGSWVVDGSLNVLTNRRAGYRADVLKLSGAYVIRPAGFELSAGGGVALRGQFGGEAVQNRYHRWTGARELDLQYAQGGLVPLLTLAARTPVQKLRAMRSAAYAEAEVTGGVVPGNVLAGGFVSCCRLFRSGGVSGELRADLAYVAWFGTDWVTAPLFERGWARSLNARVWWARRGSMGLLVSRNEHGTGLPQFGFRLTVGPPNSGRVFQK